MKIECSFKQSELKVRTKSSEKKLRKIRKIVLIEVCKRV